MQCPKCSGECYDNRKENDVRLATGEKLRPDWKCKDKDCSGVIWRAKNGAKSAPVATEKQPYSAGPPLPGEDATLPFTKIDAICAASNSFLKHVLQTEVPQLVKAEIGASDTYVHARVANLLITAEKAGVFR